MLSVSTEIVNIAVTGQVRGPNIIDENIEARVARDADGDTNTNPDRAPEVGLEVVPEVDLEEDRGPNQGHAHISITHLH